MFYVAFKGLNSVWTVGTHAGSTEGTSMVNARSGAALNVDANSCTTGAIVHTYRTGNEIQFQNISISGGPWQTVLKFNTGTPSRSMCGGLGMCLNDGSGSAVPPSRKTEHVIAGQIKIASCTDASATGWRRVLV